MTCKHVQSRLSAYLDRELPGAELLAMRSHLASCAACREEEDALRQLKRFLGAAPTPEPPADFAERLTARVLAEREPAIRRQAIFRRPVFAFAGVAACSMAVTFGLLSAAGPKPAPSAVASGTQDLSFEVQRDQAYASGLDPTSGVPVISVAQDAP